MEKLNECPKAKVINQEVHEPMYKVHKSKDELIKIIELPQEKKFYLACANRAVFSKSFDTLKEAEECVKKKPIELIVNTTITCLKMMEEQR